jgi:HPt (histidine-containing phosphotransfer) domain-containing protein
MCVSPDSELLLEHGADRGAADFDAADLLARVDDDHDMVVELIETLRAEVPVRVAEIRHALDAGDHRTLSFAAHALKGALAALSACNAARAAQALELAGRAGHAPDGPELVDRLERALASAERAFVRFCASRG